MDDKEDSKTKKDEEKVSTLFYFTSTRLYCGVHKIQRLSPSVKRRHLGRQIYVHVQNTVPKQLIQLIILQDFVGDRFDHNKKYAMRFVIVKSASCRKYLTRLSFYLYILHVH